jgi:cobalt-zinc-cadmium efflux system protein
MHSHHTAHPGHAHHAESGHDHQGHAHAGAGGDRRRLFLAAILTAGFMLLEAAAGLVTGSLALLADAGHMLTDAVALGLALVADRMGDRPGTRRMTYGFERLQVLVAYTNGLAIIAIALWIGVEAIGRLAAPARVLGGPMLAVACAGLAVNAVVFLILHGGERSSLNMRGAILHVLGDLLGSLAAILAAGIILATGWTPADPLLSMLVCLLLIGSAWRLIRESGLVLLEGAPVNVDRNDVADDLAAHTDGVADVHHMHVWSLDGQQLLATLHARLAAGADPEGSIAAIKSRLARVHNIRHATVEIETGSGCPDGASREPRSERDGTT